MINMNGVRLSGIPEEISEKQLKTHFSNPKYGGGHVSQIYYPLQDNGAVVLFDSPSVMMEIFKFKHQLADCEIQVTPLPRQIYSRGEMHLEKGVSVVLSFNRPILDELQYIGNVKVDFDYNQECYALKGTWYQLEWALHLLDRSLDCMEGIGRNSKMDRIEKKQSEEATEISDSSVKPPLYATYKSSSLDDGAEALSHGDTASGFTDSTLKAFFDDDAEVDSLPKELKFGTDITGMNKSRTLQQNKARHNKSTKGCAPGTPVYARSTKATYDKDTAFTEFNSSLSWKEPPKTSGLDVSLTDFGDARLLYDFELNKCLKVVVVKGDITKEKTDGIVSPNTPDLANSYGISSAIARAAGHKFQVECYSHVNENGTLGVAEIVPVEAGGYIDCHVGFILNTVGPNWREKDSEACLHYLVCTYLNCFQYAENILRLKSLSAPLISAGTYGFPLDCCIQAFFDALLIHMTYVGTRPHLKEVHLVCYDSDSTGAAIMILQSLLEVDRKQSESASLERYHVGCDKFAFDAKMLKNEESVKGDKDVSVAVKKLSIAEKIATKSRDMMAVKREENNTEKEIQNVNTERMRETTSYTEFGSTITSENTPLLQSAKSEKYMGETSEQFLSKLKLDDKEKHNSIKIDPTEHIDKIHEMPSNVKVTDKADEKVCTEQRKSDIENVDKEKQNSIKIDPTEPIDKIHEIPSNVKVADKANEKVCTELTKSNSENDRNDLTEIPSNVKVADKADEKVYTELTNSVSENDRNDLTEENMKIKPDYGIKEFSIDNYELEKSFEEWDASTSLCNERDQLEKVNSIGDEFVNENCHDDVIEKDSATNGFEYISNSETAENGSAFKLGGGILSGVSKVENDLLMKSVTNNMVLEDGREAKDGRGELNTGIDEEFVTGLETEINSKHQEYENASPGSAETLDSVKSDDLNQNKWSIIPDDLTYD